ncbi:hypothetical protein D3C75_1275880 [compost metagenome]
MVCINVTTVMSASSTSSHRTAIWDKPPGMLPRRPEAMLIPVRLTVIQPATKAKATVASVAAAMEGSCTAICPATSALKVMPII